MTRFLIRMEWPNSAGRRCVDWCGRRGWSHSIGVRPAASEGMDKAQADWMLTLMLKTPGLAPGTTFTPEAVEE